MDNWLRQRAYSSPDSCALVYENREYTFAQLYHESLHAASRLIQIVPSVKTERKASTDTPCRIGLLPSNTDSFYITITALMQLGVQIVMLNTRLSPVELRYQIVDADLHEIIYCDEAKDSIRELQASLPEHTITPILISDIHTADTYQCETYQCKTPALSDHALRAHILNEWDPDSVMSILYTSGTTGSPKGVLQTYGNHYSSALAAVLNTGLNEHDTWVCFTPLYHISGLSILLRGIIYGIPVYLFKKFNPNAINTLILEEKATIVSVVTYALRALVEDLGEKSYPQSFRYMLLGGGFFENSLLERCAQKNIPVIRSFGMSETCSQVIATPLWHLPSEKVGSSGIPLFSNQLRISSNSSICTHPQGNPPEVGEIQIKSPALCIGYLNKDAAYAASFTADGWYKTGDIGYLDDDGYLYVKSRLTDLIISGGENIYPADIEHCLVEHPAIAEAAVVGHSDPVWNQVPWAYIVPNPSYRLSDTQALTSTLSSPSSPLPSAEELKKFCSRYLAAYKIPQRFIWLDELPKTAVGKVKKYVLCEHETPHSTHTENYNGKEYEHEPNR